MAKSHTKKTNKGGAPKKSEEDKIAPVISVYFSNKQYEILEDYMKENHLVVNKKSGLIKEIIMNSILDKQLVLKKQNDPKLIFEINKIGININQIAKKLNSLDAISKGELDRMQGLIKEMSDFISRA